MANVVLRLSDTSFTLPVSIFRNADIVNLELDEAFGRSDDRLRIELHNVIRPPYLSRIDVNIDGNDFGRFEVESYSYDNSGTTTIIDCIRGGDGFYIANQIISGLASTPFPSNERAGRITEILGEPLHTFLAQQIILAGPTPTYESILNSLNDYGFTIYYGNIGDYPTISTDFGDVQVVPMDAVRQPNRALPASALFSETIVDIASAANRWQTRPMVIALPQTTPNRLTQRFGSQTQTRDVLDLGEIPSYRWGVARVAGERVRQAVNAESATAAIALDGSYNLRDGISYTAALASEWIITAISHNLQQNATTLTLSVNPNIAVNQLIDGGLAANAIPDAPELTAYVKTSADDISFAQVFPLLADAGYVVANGDFFLMQSTHTDAGAPFQSVRFEQTGDGDAQNTDYPGNPDPSANEYDNYLHLANNLLASNIYQYRSRAANQLGAGEWSNAYSYDPPDDLPPYITSVFVWTKRDLRLLATLPDDLRSAAFAQAAQAQLTGALVSRGLSTGALGAVGISFGVLGAASQLPNVFAASNFIGSVAMQLGIYRSVISLLSAGKLINFGQSIINIGVGLQGLPFLSAIAPVLSVLNVILLPITGVLTGNILRQWQANRASDGISFVVQAWGNGYSLNDTLSAQIATGYIDSGGNPVWLPFQRTPGDLDSIFSASFNQSVSDGNDIRTNRFYVITLNVTDGNLQRRYQNLGINIPNDIFMQFRFRAHRADDANIASEWLYTSVYRYSAFLQSWLQPDGQYIPRYQDNPETTDVNEQQVNLIADIVWPGIDDAPDTSFS